MIWETDFASPPESDAGSLSQIDESCLDPAIIESVYLLHWREHCLECAPPECYRSCALYVTRTDKRCARFNYGIYPNRSFRGLYKYGADIQFRRWAHLGSTLRSGAATPRQLVLLDRFSQLAISWIANPLGRALIVIDPERWSNRLLVKARENLLKTLGRLNKNASKAFDEFVIEAWNPTNKEFRILVQASQDGGRFRGSFLMRPGRNFHRIPFEGMNLDLSLGEGSLSIFPDADEEVRLIFTWLNFVRYKDRNRSADSGLGSTQLLSAQMRRPIQPAEKVKCVVWDLDNTLWEGILVEDGPDGVTLLSEALALLKAFDERGIVQSIASKNDHDAAWSVIVALGLSEYFIYPSIYWGPKSESLIAIANAYNFNLDSVALIDDSAVERAEVSSKLPQVRVYRESDIPDLAARKEFDVPITSASKLRRQSYLAEAKRKNVALNFDSNNIDFLMNCKLEFELFVPTDEEEWDRCHELLRRTNQLNLSNRDYDEEAFRSLIRDTTITKIGGRCKDRFGDYGIIGFWILTFKEEEARLIDFVQSCRVANKKLENAFFAWILKMLRQQNYSEIKVTFIPTERNNILLDILYDIGFEKIGEAENGIDLRLSISARPEHCDVVQLRDNVSSLAPAMAVTT